MPTKAVMGLWVLIIGVVAFLSTFTGILSILPPEIFGTYVNRYNTYGTGSETFSATSWNSYNASLNFTLGHGSTIKDSGFGSAVLNFRWAYVTASIDYLTIEHFTGTVNLGVLGWLVWSSDNLVYDNGKDKLGLVEIFDPSHYDTARDTSKVVWSCPHITITINYVSNTTGKTLHDVLTDSGGVVLLIINYQIDISSMGLNMWQVLANVLTFQAIRSGNAMIDVLLNSIVSFPTWTAFAYIAYKLIAGVIPFVSGGGGGG